MEKTGSRLDDVRVLRMRQIEALTGMKRSWIYGAMLRGEFPQRIKLGVRAVGWREAEVLAWLEVRTRNRERALPNKPDDAPVDALDYWL